jgi:c-di-GMP-binding flagellar brake protein YcgR
MQRRRYPRVSVAGKVRLLADTSNGLITLAGTVVDLSVSGCAIRVHTALDVGREARLELEVDGKAVWMPGRIVWKRAVEKAWMVGVQFESLVPEKQTHVMKVVARRRNLAV